MTPLLQQTSTAVRNPALAGLEFGSGEVISLLAIVAIVFLVVLIYVATFVGVLVSSVHHLYKAGRIQHPFLLVLMPVVALAVAFQAGGGVVGPMLTVGGLGFGYALMFYAGRSWFRWTLFPAVPFVVAAVVGAR
jgi:hypothetical protein